MKTTGVDARLFELSPENVDKSQISNNNFQIISKSQYLNCKQEHYQRLVIILNFSHCLFGSWLLCFVCYLPFEYCNLFFLNPL